jgi:DNA-binding Lrp family transcriptional regulator
VKEKKEIDEKDKKILTLLVNDSSLSYSEIQKETKIPAYVVANRIRKLEKSTIIKGYKLLINYPLFGFEEFEVYLRLMGADTKKTLDIIHDLEKDPHVSWIGTCFGSYDLKLNVLAQSNAELYSTLYELFKKHRDLIKGEEISSITKKHKSDKLIFIRSILQDETLSIKDISEQKQYKTAIEARKKTFILDKTDLTIIKTLGLNPRIRLSELAKITKLTLQGVKNRVDALKQKRVILGSSTLINGQALGFVWSTCLFRTNLSEVQEEILKKHIYTLKNTSSAVRLIGKWNLGITFFEKNIDAVQQRINEFKGMFKDNIEGYDSLVILEIYKYPKLPECLYLPNSLVKP